MATVIFRSKSDNRVCIESNKPKGRGTWYVFYYGPRGTKVRKRVGPNRRVAEAVLEDIEAELVTQRGGLLDPEQELTRMLITSFREKLPSFVEMENKAPKTRTRYEGVFRVFVLLSERVFVNFTSFHSAISVSCCF